MADETSGLYRSVEDYLKVIYSLCEPGEVASTSAIAETLEVQPASVTGMVKRLAEAGYLEHVPYRGVQLTEAGTRILVDDFDTGARVQRNGHTQDQESPDEEKPDDDHLGEQRRRDDLCEVH